MATLINYKVFTVVVVLVGLFAFYSWYSNPVRVAEKLSGLNLPTGTELLRMEKQWPGGGPDGYSIWVLKLPSEFAEQEALNCNFPDYVLDEFYSSKLGFHSNDLISSIVPENQKSCFKLTKSEGSLELVLFYEDKFVAFVSQI